MLELFLCSLLTVFPDYLYRRYVQGKRFGREITLYTVWYELRWGITLCLILTVSLITVVFFYHPSTKSTISYFRTIPILPEIMGRVDEVYVDVRSNVKAGDKLFRLDSSKQEAALESARRRVLEVDAAFEQAKIELLVADGRIQEAQSALYQAQDELATKQELDRRKSGTVSQRELERLALLVESRQGSLDAANANKKSVETQISTTLPAQKASAEAQVAEAQVQLDKTVVYASVDGTLEQFALRKGDIVNPLMRPAGILIPLEAGRRGLWAGFGQIEAQIMKPGMTAEVTCAALPFQVVPMVVTEVQDIIAAGQVRPTDQLLDPLQAARPGTITVFMEPMFKGGFADIPPGSQCIANAYTNNHDALADPNIGTGKWLFLHMVDTVALVHAMILRVQALLLPVQTLVFAGH
ncbi:MAG: HlyD family secretion protein [Rhizobiales bacterium]|nr:HlyD family secretion protein [Hyphomicrobiales bacterium]